MKLGCRFCGTWWLLLCLFVVVVSCRRNQTGPPRTREIHAHRSRSVPTKRTVQTEQPPLVNMPEGWLAQTSVEAIAQDFDILVKLLRDADPDQKADAVSLLLDQYKKLEDGESLDPKKMTPAHRALRARLHLRLAHFYDQAFALALLLQAETFSRRLQRKDKLKLGQLFYYHHGRLLCLQGKYKEAITSLLLAKEQIQTSHKSRVAAWLSVCHKEPSQRNQAVDVLSSLPWDKESEGWAESIFIHAYFGLTPKNNPPQQISHRASLFVAASTGTSWKPQTDAMRGIIDTESIEENSVTTTLSYYDPAPAWAGKQYHSRAALRYLALTTEKDRFAPYYQAQAEKLLGHTEQALMRWQSFLQYPPTGWDWGYTIFSPQVRIADFLAEAELQVALLLHNQGKTTEATQRLSLLQKKGFPEKFWATFGLFWLQSDNKAQTELWTWMWAGAEMANRLDQQLWTRYLKMKAEKKGAAAIEQYRLHRYASRLLYLRASEVALHIGASDKAVRWMEALHHKDKPYAIGHGNQPAQIILTMRAYMQAGRWDVAGLFAARNKEAFPVLTQHWFLFGLLRIFRGMGNPASAKGD